MKKFIITFTVFVLPLVAGLLLLEYRLSLLPNSYNQKTKAIEKKLATIEVLNVGSSSALYGINPAVFSRPAFNLANVSQTMYYDRRLVEHYIDHMPRLKKVIIPIGYNSMFRKLEELQEDWRMYFYYYYWKIDCPGKSMFDINRYSLIYIYSPHTTMGFIRRNFKTSPELYNEFGYSWRDSAGHLKAMTDERGRERVAYHTEGYSEKNIQDVTADLAGFVASLRKRNIEVVFITNPVYKTYYDHCNPAILARNSRIVDSLCAQYNCTMHNYLQDSRFTADDFYDADHLSFVGAAKYSAILDSEVVR